MQSQQKNPPEVLHSLHRQIGSSDNCGGPESPPFSIRKYVLACRQKDIFHSWPFPEKYLQICLKHGINDVLPPLESHHSAIQSLRGDVHFNYCSQQNDENAGSCKKIVQITVGQEEMLKEECNLYSDEEISKGSSQDVHLSLSSNSYKHEEDGNNRSSGVASDTVVSRNQLHFPQHNKIMNGAKRLRNKRKRRKGKRKKRSMVDILAAAKPCTLEDLLRINRLCCGLSKPFENEIKRTEQMTDNSKSELTEEDSNEKLQTDDCDAADVDMLAGNRWVVKFKLNGCNPFPRDLD